MLVLRTSEALIAGSDVEGALLHGQLVELGELRRDGSRGRLREGERRRGGETGGKKERKRRMSTLVKYSYVHKEQCRSHQSVHLLASCDLPLISALMPLWEVRPPQAVAWSADKFTG